MMQLIIIPLVFCACLAFVALRRASRLPFPPGPVGYPLVGVLSGNKVVAFNVVPPILRTFANQLPSQ